MVLADCCMPRRRVGGTKVAVGRRRPPWLKSVSGTHFVSVCVLFYLDVIATIAENRLRSIINENFFKF
jgi:hypothetical protein